MKWLIAAVLAACSLAASAQTDQLTNDEYYAAQAWRFACVIRDVDCRYLQPPKVVLTDELNREDQGMYVFAQPRTVFAAKAFSGDPYLTVVLVHEMTHYLQFLERGPMKDHAEMCDREHEAFDVDMLAARLLGLEDHPDVFAWTPDIVRFAYHCAPDQLQEKDE